MGQRRNPTAVLNDWYKSNESDLKRVLKLHRSNERKISSDFYKKSVNGLRLVDRRP